MGAVSTASNEVVVRGRRKRVRAQSKTHGPKDADT